MIWTPNSVNSDWVISEADRARAARKLVPLRLPAVAPHDIPPPFDRLHTEIIGDVERLTRSLAVLGAVPSSRARRAESLLPNDARQYVDRGFTLLNNQDNDQAIADFTKAIELDPKYAHAYLGRGNANILKAEHDRAIADYTKAIELDPKFADAYYYRGLTYERLLGNKSSALADFRRAFSLGQNKGKDGIERLGGG